MRILMVMPFFPYPPTDGGRIGFFNPIKYLSREHELALVTLASDGNQAHIGELKRFCGRVEVCVAPRRSSTNTVVRSILMTPPGTSNKYWYPPFGDVIRRIAHEFQPEVAEFHHLNTAAYGNYVDTCPKILREHNVEYKVWERFAVHSTKILERLYVRTCAPLVRNFEARMASQFDKCVTVSDADARFLNEINPAAPVEVIPSGVDTEYFQSTNEVVPTEPCSLVLTGSFEWKPKEHNLRILLGDIFPRITKQLPEAKLHIVGKGIASDIREQYKKDPRVVITGEVKDVRPFIERSSLVLNYLESGGGIALKVLEAMAMRKPVLSNFLGSEGINAKHGIDIFLADGREEFADAAVWLLKNPDVCASIAKHGLELVRRKYSWHVISKQFTKCYEDLVQKHRTASVTV